jgi:regulatory protein
MRSAKRKLDSATARARAETACSRAETCSFAMRRKLEAWGVNREEAEGIIRRLKEGRFIDDERYARAYVRDKVRFSGWGKRKIDRMLQAKRIGRETREAAFAEIGEPDDDGKLRRLLTEKARAVKARNRYELRVKLFRFALGRGFTADQIHAALADVLEENCQGR